jgi:hypothetical protein
MLLHRTFESQPNMSRIGTLQASTPGSDTLRHTVAVKVNFPHARDQDFR